MTYESPEGKTDNQAYNKNKNMTYESPNTSKEVKSTTKALPETGQTSNSEVITIVAAILLAAGSFLTFRKVSKSK